MARVVEFPANCTGQKYFTSPTMGGVGSNLFTHSHALVSALITGRIFDWTPENWRHEDNVTCKNLPLSIECFLRRPTNCSAASAPESDVINVHSGQHGPFGESLFQFLVSSPCQKSGPALRWPDRSDSPRRAAHSGASWIIRRTRIMRRRCKTTQASAHLSAPRVKTATRTRRATG